MDMQARKPAFIRSDNGGQFAANAVIAWLSQRNVGSAFIDPGCPWQSGIEPIIPARSNNKKATHQDGHKLKRYKHRWIDDRSTTTNACSHFEMLRLKQD